MYQVYAIKTNKFFTSQSISCCYLSFNHQKNGPDFIEIGHVAETNL